ncbi:MAG: NmrA/HSCARG family protein [Chloroflexota bacterium]
MTTSQKTILVLGATGRQGGATARHLLDKGWNVRVLVRDPNKAAAQDSQNRGAEVVQGDFDDAASLAKAMNGVYGAFSVQAYSGTDSQSELYQGKAIADAAKAASVQHFVYTSAQSAEGWAQAGDGSKWAIEQYVWSLGLPATILRPSTFMDDLLDARYGIPDGSFTTAFKPDVKMGLIASDDIGAFAALAFEHPEIYLGKTLEISGDALTAVQVAAEISKAMGRTITYQQIPIENMRKQNATVAAAFDFLNAVGYPVDIGALRQQYPDLMNLETYFKTVGQPLVEARR